MAVRCRTTHTAIPPLSAHRHHPRWGSRQYRFMLVDDVRHIAVHLRDEVLRPSNVVSAKTGPAGSYGQEAIAAATLLRGIRPRGPCDMSGRSSRAPFGGLSAGSRDPLS